MNQKRREQIRLISQDIREKFNHPHPRPAGMGLTCDNYFVNPHFHIDGDQPLLIRCKLPATTRFVLADSRDSYTVKRCQVCAAELRQASGTFEVLSEEAV